MRFSIVAVLIGAISSYAAQAETVDSWKKYTPMMVAEIYAMSSASEEAVAEMEARGKYLLEQLGIKESSSLLSMTNAIEALVSGGHMDGTLRELRETVLLDELLPSLPQDQPIAQLFSSPSSIDILQECLRDGAFGQQATCQALGIYLASQWGKPDPKVLKSLKHEFLNQKGVYGTIIELSQYLVDTGSQDANSKTVSEPATDMHGQTRDVTLDVMQAKRKILDAVLDARKISML